MSQKVAKFVKQLYEMLHTPANGELIRFRADGNTFEVTSIRALEDLVFPSVFKHRNYASFHRQLLTHEFVKVGAPNEYIYRHEHFMRDRPDLLHLVRRVANKSSGAARGSPDEHEDEERKPDILSAMGSASSVAYTPVELLDARFAALENEVAELRAQQVESTAELRAANARLWSIVTAQEEAQAFVQTALKALFSYLSSNGIVDFSKIFDASLNLGTKKRKREREPDSVGGLPLIPRITSVSPMAESAPRKGFATASPFTASAPFATSTLSQLADLDFGSPMPTPKTATAAAWPRFESAAPQTVPHIQWPLVSATDQPFPPVEPLAGIEALRAEVRARKREALLFDDMSEMPSAALAWDAASDADALPAGAGGSSEPTLDSLATAVLDALATGAAERRVMIQNYHDEHCIATALDDDGGWADAQAEAMDF